MIDVIKNVKFFTFYIKRKVFVDKNVFLFVNEIDYTYPKNSWHTVYFLSEISLKPFIDLTVI